MSTPFMQLYIGDYLRDTGGLTTEGHGAYLLLLMAMWNADGYLPNDPAKLARYARMTAAKWAKLAPDIMPFFTVVEDRITQKRLAKQLENANEKSQKRSQSGKLGGEAKALKDKETALANATVLPCHSPEPEPERERIVSKEPILLTPKRAEAGRGGRLPDGWTPVFDYDPEAYGLSREQHDLELEKFHDFWRAVPGAKGRKVDWPATWRNWMRNAAQRQPRKPHERSHPDQKQLSRFENYAAAQRGAELAANLRRVGE